jgi:hypothetical protein
VALEVVYGPPSQERFGSAIFTKQLDGEERLEEAAQRVYQEFVGGKWQAWGEET